MSPILSKMVLKNSFRLDSRLLLYRIFALLFKNKEKLLVLIIIHKYHFHAPKYPKKRHSVNLPIHIR